MSAPETILVELPLGGIDAYTESKWLVPGKLAELENARFDAPPGLNKRKGYTVLTRETDVLGGGQLDGCRRLAYLQGEICIFGEHKFYAYSATPAWWLERGSYPEPTVSNLKVASDLRYDLTNTELAYNGNVGVVVWQNNEAAVLGNLNCIVFSRTTGEVLKAQRITSLLGTQLQQLRTFAVGNYLYVLGLGDVNQIQWTRIDITTNNYTFPATSVLGATGSTHPASFTRGYDVCVLASDYYVIYKTTVGPAIRVDRFPSTTNTSAANHIVAEDPDGCMGITANEAVSIVWCTSTVAIKHEALNVTTLANVAGPASIGGVLGTLNASRVTFGRISSTKQLVVVQDEAAARKQLRWVVVATTGSGGTAGTAQLLRDLHLISKTFSQDFKLYVCGCFDSSEQGTGYLVEVGLIGQSDNARAPRWTATFKRGRVAPFATPSYLPQVPIWDLSTQTYDVPFRAKQKFRFAGKDDQDIIITQHWIERTRFNFNILLPPDFVEWGVGSFIAQGRPSWYDGVSYTEHGFAWHPEQPTASFTSGGIFPASVEINGQLTYEALDARGMLHRSTPSAIAHGVQSGGLASAKFRLTLNNGLELTDRTTTPTYWASPRTAAQVVPYRSTAGVPTGPGVQFFRSKAPPIGFDTASGTNIDVGTSGASETDADIQANELLYTEGDILANDGTPPCRLCIAHGNPRRLWLGGLEEDDQLAFSQPYVDGEAPRFNEGLRVRVGRPVTAIGGMDDKVVAWSRYETFVIAGNGPPASGDIDVGFRVHLLTSDAGCIEPRSVVSTPQGLMFQSAKGIYLLGRDMSVRYIGAPIRRLLESFPLITGSALLTSKNEVRFSATSSSHESGVLFVYDYAQDQWSVDTLPTPPITCAMLGTQFGWANIAGQVYVENAGFADDAAWIVMRLVTPWITPRMIQGPSGTLQGWQGLRSVGVLGDNLGSHGIRIRVGYDYESAWTDDQTYTATEVAALSHEHIQLTPSRMNCKAFRVEVRDVAGTTVNEGMKLSSLSFEVDIDRRRSLLASAQVR